MGSLVEEARELHEQLAATTGSADAWAMSLTGAELRLLPYLATHLMFPEIADQAVHLAQHRQDRSGLDLPQARLSSRSEAIDRAVEVGLLESSIYPPPEISPTEG